MTYYMYTEIKYLFVIFTFTFLSGCIILPYTEEESFERQIDEEVLLNIDRGKTTRQEILDWFGTPNAIVASGATKKAPPQDIRKKRDYYVKSQDFLKMFSAKHNLTKKHIGYYYETSAYHSWHLVLFLLDMYSGNAVIDDKPIGTPGLMIRKLWILIDIEKGHVVDYIFHREKKKSSNVSVTTSAADTGSIFIRIETNKGNIVLELYPDKAPKTIANFLQYIEDGFYENTIFHRVINGFMIQGGGFTPEFERKEPDATIKNEATNGLKNVRGTIAMARTNNPHSASTQFFINVVDNSFLDHTSKTPRGWGYTVFGHVIKGMNVIDKIRKIRTGPSGPFPSDVPVKTVLIHKATIIGEKPVSTKKK